MINNLLSGLSVFIGVLFGDYISSVVFGSVKGLKELLIEVVLFLVLFNLFVFNILIVDELIVQLIVYFLVSFVSIISSKSFVFLLFRKVSKLVFKKNEFNIKCIKLSKLLNKKLNKEDVVELFKKSGFGTAFVNHLNKVLK